MQFRLETKFVRAVLGFCILALGGFNLTVFIGGHFNGHLDPLSNGAPVLLAVGLLLTWLAWKAGGRVLFITCLVAALAPPAIVVVGDELGALRIPAGDVGPRIKILSLNVWSQNSNLGAVEAFIRAEAPEIILLQEASTKRHRELLARLGDMYPTNFNTQPHCSTRVLSRLRLVQDVGLASCDLVGARLELPQQLGGGEIVAVSVHLPRGVSPAIQGQVSAAREFLPRVARESAIIGGDFNSTPWSASLRRFDHIPGISRRTRGLATWPSPRQNPLGPWSPPWPLFPIDHVYATTDWRTVSVRAGPDVGSDHLPVIVELVRRTEAVPDLRGRQ